MYLTKGLSGQYIQYTVKPTKLWNMKTTFKQFYFLLLYSKQLTIKLRSKMGLCTLHFCSNQWLLKSTPYSTILLVQTWCSLFCINILFLVLIRGILCYDFFRAAVQKGAEVVAINDPFIDLDYMVYMFK